MKAIVCKEFGPPSSLVYEDVELPELKKSQILVDVHSCLLYTSPSPRDRTRSRMPSSA